MTVVKTKPSFTGMSTAGGHDGGSGGLKVNSTSRCTNQHPNVAYVRQGGNAVMNPSLSSRAVLGICR